MSLKRKEEQIGYLKKRIDVFVELLAKGDITKVNVDTTSTEQLIRLLDTAVIKLEGGSDDDLRVLDEKPVVINTPIAPKTDEKPKNETEESKAAVNEDSTVESKKEESKKRESKKRRRTHSDSSSSSDSSDSDSESESEKNKTKSSENGDESNAAAATTAADEDNEEKDKLSKDEDDDDNEDGAEKQDQEPKNGKVNDDDVEMKTNENGEENAEVKKSSLDESEGDNNKIDEEVVDLDKEEDEDDGEKPKKLEELHKTSSIFLRNLAPTITKAEVEALCKRYDGFLRVAIADPAVDRRWFRRGWITFKRDVNIKEICWNLNNIRLRDCELAPIVNRDLTRRVRPVNGITAHKTICKNDIKICAKIAHSLDEKYGLWKDCIDEMEKVSFGLQSKNPVLKNITDYLIEEADAEEEELLGLSSENKDESEGEFLDRDPELIAVLDKIILYLRIVHSVDFYSKKFIIFILIIF
jgi:hypothetical protein